MNLLQYTSHEMFSSTELIRKSKNIFDKLSKNEIEKAIILRDGKPSFMLLEFKMYEELIANYMDTKNEIEKLKELLRETKNSKDESTKKEFEIIEEKQNVINEEVQAIDEIENSDLQDVLEKIDQLDISGLSKKSLEEEKKDQQLKDFWE